MNKIDRNIALQKLSEIYRGEYVVIACSYKNVKNYSLASFRKELKAKSGLKAIAIKNSINKLAVKGTNYSDMANISEGQNLFIFVKDPDNLIGVSQAIVNSVNDNVADSLKFKVMFYKKKEYDISFLRTLSKIENKDVLRATLLGILSAAMSSLLFILSQKKELFGNTTKTEEC